MRRRGGERGRQRANGGPRRAAVGCVRRMVWRAEGRHDARSRRGRSSGATLNPPDPGGRTLTPRCRCTRRGWSGGSASSARWRGRWSASPAAGPAFLELAGEPGIGKTRLLGELAAQAAAARLPGARRARDGVRARRALRPLGRRPRAALRRSTAHGCGGWPATSRGARRRAAGVRRARSARRRRRPSATSSTARCAACSSGSRRRARWCSASTTCTGPIPPRSTCWRRWPAARPGRRAARGRLPRGPGPGRAARGARRRGPRGRRDGSRRRRSTGPRRRRCAAAIAAELYALSGGNPFYLEQLARARPDAGRRALGPGGAGIPAAVAAALAGELDALPAPPGACWRPPRSPASRLSPTSSPTWRSWARRPRWRRWTRCSSPRSSARPRRPGGSRSGTRRPPRRLRGRPGAWRLQAHARAAAALERRGAGPVERAHHVEHAARRGDRAAVGLLAEAARSVFAQAPAIAARHVGRRCGSCRTMPAAARAPRAHADAGLRADRRGTARGGARRAHRDAGARPRRRLGAAGAADLLPDVAGRVGGTPRRGAAAPPPRDARRGAGAPVARRLRAPHAARGTRAHGPAARPRAGHRAEALDLPAASATA